MSYLIKPEGYKPLLDLKQTELGIKRKCSGAIQSINVPIR